MSIAQKIYTFTWVIACFSCGYIWFARLDPFIFSQKEYWKFLSRPWKLGTFVVITLFMVLIAPYSGDYTWDYGDGFFMSVLTFVTSPWVVGIIFKIKNRQASLRQFFLAFCLWMFSASWSYDLYLYLRDGSYTTAWLANLVVSSILYFSAGLFWNLDWKPEKGVYYSFTEDKWFESYQGPVFWKILSKGWMYVLLAGIILGSDVLIKW